VLRRKHRTPIALLRKSPCGFADNPETAVPDRRARRLLSRSRPGVQNQIRLRSLLCVVAESCDVGLILLTSASCTSLAGRSVPAALARGYAAVRRCQSGFSDCCVTFSAARAVRSSSRRIKGLQTDARSKWVATLQGSSSRTATAGSVRTDRKFQSDSRAEPQNVLLKYPRADSRRSMIAHRGSPRSVRLVRALKTPGASFDA
jgi:hypothetical protein